jgi:hypothetical protein
MVRTPQESTDADAAEQANALRLAPGLQALFQQSFPRFSDAEYGRRLRALAQAMQHAEVDHLLVICAQRVGNAVHWLTSSPAK